MVTQNDFDGEKSKLSLQDYVRKFNELSTVFDSIPTGIFAILDQKSNIATINKTAGEILDSNTNSFIGKNVHEVFGDRLPGIQKLIEETIKNRRPIKNFTLEIRDRNADAKTYLVSTAITGEFGSMDFGVVLVLHDISEVTRLRKAVMSRKKFGPLIGDSTAMKEIYSRIETVAQYDTTILISGETGTGKELVARAIHQSSPRCNGPFVPVNCSALNSSLLESELFGHVKGAFTGAINNHCGRFEVARGGTIFLDEVGTLSLAIQVKLLRTLQEKVIERVGSSELIPTDVRVISATNQNLSKLIIKGEFRDDLYYRLKVLQIDIPPLRERWIDIPILCEFFIEKYNKLYNRNIIALSPAANNLLMKYQWPGNIRELENAIEHSLVLAPGKIIEPQHLPPEIRNEKNNILSLTPEQERATEEEIIRRALAATVGNVTRAAASLGMHRTTLWRKMKELDIPRFENGTATIRSSLLA